MSHELRILTEGLAKVNPASQQEYNFLGIVDSKFNTLVGKYNISNLELKKIHSIYQHHIDRIRTESNEIQYDILDEQYKECFRIIFKHYLRKLGDSESDLQRGQALFNFLFVMSLNIMLVAFELFVFSSVPLGLLSFVLITIILATNLIFEYANINIEADKKIDKEIEDCIDEKMINFLPFYQVHTPVSCSSLLSNTSMDCTTDTESASNASTPEPQDKKNLDVPTPEEMHEIHNRTNIFSERLDQLLKKTNDFNGNNFPSQ